MGSTHYMDLLMMNSPWNLIFFMAIPVVLAESIAISELYILYKQPTALPSLEKFKISAAYLPHLLLLQLSST